MFCPRCGSQNSDETKYCRGCGADLGGVLGALEGRPQEVSALAEKHIDLFSSGLRGLLIGLGFLIVSGVAFETSTRTAVLGIFALAFGFFFFGTGVSRLVQARALKRLRESKTAPALTSGRVEYIKPTGSTYETDGLITTPRSVTEHTTTHLDKKSVNGER